LLIFSFPYLLGVQAFKGIHIIYKIRIAVKLFIERVESDVRKPACEETFTYKE